LGIIFISHSSRNNDQARAVRDWLKSEGYAEVFLDLDPEHGLAPGQRWQQELKNAGERCSAIVLVITPDWVASEWCQTEFLVADQLGKRIFPVIVEPTPFERIRIELRASYQIADISTQERRADGLERLRVGLRRAGLDPREFQLKAGRPPYRGLKALEEDDAAIFFGRDLQITGGLDALRQMKQGGSHRILTIAAGSGAGKSSFLKAGLLARLQRDTENFLVLPTWRPSRDALNGVTGLSKSFGASDPHTAVASLAARQAAIVEHFRALESAANSEWRGTAPTIVLPLDQAEELFSADNASSSAAIALLVEVLARKPDLIVAATIRSDALGSLQSDNRLASQLKLFNLPALPASAFRDVIEGPARVASPAISIEPALTEKLVAELDQADALPLLAFTLERLVTEYGKDGNIRLEEFELGLGGIEGAINSAVEAALSKAERALGLTRAEMETVARQTFVPGLVWLDEADSPPRRRVASISAYSGAKRALIDQFVEERLLVSYEIESQSVVEVSHEAVLRHWKKLGDWISEERLDLARLYQVHGASKAWSSAQDTGNSNDLLVHRGERLKLALALLDRSDFARQMSEQDKNYLTACQALEEDARRAAGAQAERERRQQRRTARWQMAATALLLAGFASVGYAALFVVKEQRAFAEEESLMLARTGEQFLLDGDEHRAFQLAVLASRESALQPSSQKGRDLFESAARSVSHMKSFRPGSDVRRASLISQGTQLLTVSDFGTAQVWNLADERALFAEEIPYAEQAALRQSDSSILTWSSVSYTAYLWDIHSLEQKHVFPHGSTITGATLFQAGKRVLTWGADGRAVLWNAETGSPFRTVVHDGPVRGAVTGRGGLRALSWGGKAAYIWNASSPERDVITMNHTGQVTGAAFSEDGRSALTWSEDGSAWLWHTDTGEPISGPYRHEGPLRSAIFNAQGSTVLTWGEDKTARLWDAASGTQVGNDLRHNGAVLGGRFWDDHTKVMTWSEDRTVGLWDAATGEEIGVLEGHEGPVLGADHSKARSEILTWSDDRMVRTWDPATRKPSGPALYHAGAILDARYTADGSQIVTWSDDKTVRSWDLQAAPVKGDRIAILETACSQQPKGAEAARPEKWTLIDTATAQAAPILRGRIGEDICTDDPRAWWDHPLTILLRTLSPRP